MKHVLATAALCLLPATHALAQTTFDVISPHEYELPVGFEPFNVFVQYATYQDDRRQFDNNGNRSDADGLERITGMSKYVRFWSATPNIGAAWEIIVPEVSLRDRAANQQNSGLGDPLTGFAIWYKPMADLTLGLQSFVQMPIGASEVSDTNWKNLTSLFWDWRLPAGFGWTADAGAVFQGERTRDDVKPGIAWHTNQRFGWRANSWLEPFVAVDAEYADGNDGLPDSWVVDAGPGVMFHTFKNQSIAVRYATSLDGKNRVVNNSANLRYAYVW